MKNITPIFLASLIYLSITPQALAETTSDSATDLATQEEGEKANIQQDANQATPINNVSDDDLDDEFDDNDAASQHLTPEEKKAQRAERRKARQEAQKRANLKTDISIEGLSGALEDNVDAYISNIPEDSYSTSLRFQSELTENIENALKALGYYSPTISYEVVEESQDENELIAHIDAGEPTMIYQSDIVILGEAADDPDFQKAIDESKLNLGRTLNHANYEALKSKLASLALQKGYFKGDFTQNLFQVSPTRNQAIIKITYDSGPRYKFGYTEILNSQIENHRVESLIPYKEGDYYNANSIGELNQNLSGTKWFSSIAVEPQPQGVNEELELPMKVHLKPEIRNQMEMGLGYSTDVGVRGKFSWTKPWLNKYGHSLNISTELSQPEQQITASYKIPLEDALNEYYQIQYGFKNEDNRDTDSLEQNLTFERHWLYENGWHQTVFMRLLYEDFTQGELSGQSLFVLPGVTWSRIRQRGEGLPMWGDSQSFTLEYGDPGFFSDARIIRTQAHTGWIRGLGENHRFLTRIDVGANFVEDDDWDDVPPSLRFFAGGLNSLRGYGYEEVSPLDDSGDLAGGQYMATSTLEYQYRLVGNWWGAMFMDYGDAWTDSVDWKTGVGVGVRWASPVGPVRFDIAYGPDVVFGDDKYQFHFSIGPEF